MSETLRNYQVASTPQSESLPGKNQVPNNAGGYTFEVTSLDRFTRFLILGVDGGTYYVNERKHAADNIGFVRSFIESDGPIAVTMIRDISMSGRAPKNSPALFALAVASVYGNDITRSLAYGALPSVARTGTHLFEFLSYRKNLEGGWGRGIRSAVSAWYLDRPEDSVAYQAVKYRSRYDWSHRDVLRLAHPLARTPGQRALFDWITKGVLGEEAPSLVEGFVKVQAATTANEAAKIVAEYGLPWETVPTQFHNDPVLWNALLDENLLPIGATIRQLGRLSKLGIDAAKPIAVISDQDRLRKGRVHPISVLTAIGAYGVGKSRGQSWEVSTKIMDALDAAFYASFPNVESAGKRTLVGLDVSASMAWSPISSVGLTPRVVVSAMALIQAATEPEFQAMAFSHGLVPVDITPRRRLDDIVRSTQKMPFGGTDCALPMMYALEKGLAVDTFVIYTDNETWFGKVHPSTALNSYRKATGIDAKLIVAATVGTGFTIADPDDAGMLDVVGFDAAVPKLIADFSAGRV